MNDYALQKRRETMRNHRLRAAGKLPPLPRCERCGQRCNTARYLPLCSGCHCKGSSYGRRRALQQAAEQVLAELRSEPHSLPAEALTELRQRLSDQVVLDYLTLVTLAPTPGIIPVATLRERWGCSQSQVSRRIHAVAATGLVDISAGWGGYQVHGVEVVA